MQFNFSFSEKGSDPKTQQAVPVPHQSFLWEVFLFALLNKMIDTTLMPVYKYETIESSLLKTGY